MSNITAMWQVCYSPSPPYAADRTPSLQRGKGGNVPGEGPPLFIDAATRPAYVLYAAKRRTAVRQLLDGS